MDYKAILTGVLASNRMGVLIYDKNCRIRFHLEPHTNIFAVKDSEEILGKKLQDLFTKPKDDFDPVQASLTDEGIFENQVRKFVDFRGNEKQAIFTTLPYYQDGKLAGVVELFGELFTYLNYRERLILDTDSTAYQKNMRKSYRSNGTIYCLDDFLTATPEITSLINNARRIADSSSPVMIYGETGTGKEILAQGIHNASEKRRQETFITQNCAAIPENLFESLLFGTSAGGFTGAKNNPGLFELADRGTLYLDEINSLDLPLQAKVLRVLEDGIIRRIGGQNTINVDVRVIAATNENPYTAIEQGKLRRDLFYRLSAINFYIPPLAERKDDIDLLVDNFISDYNDVLDKKVKGLSANARQALHKHSWPGNVRELKNTIEQIMNYIDRDTILLSDLPQNNYGFYPAAEKNKQVQPLKSPYLQDAVKDYEKDIIKEALLQANGSCSKAAKILKMSRHTLYYKIKKHNITVNSSVQ